MKKKNVFVGLGLVFVFLFLIQSVGQAFLYEIKILPKEAIAKLTDQDLEDAYVEAKIEEKASQEFHIAAGYSSPKEYQARKDLLRYLFELRREMDRREKVEADTLDGYFK